MQCGEITYRCESRRHFSAERTDNCGTWEGSEVVNCSVIAAGTRVPSGTECVECSVSEPGYWWFLTCTSLPVSGSKRAVHRVGFSPAHIDCFKSPAVVQILQTEVSFWQMWKNATPHSFSSSLITVWENFFCLNQQRDDHWWMGECCETPTTDHVQSQWSYLIMICNVYSKVNVRCQQPEFTKSSYRPASAFHLHHGRTCLATFKRLHICGWSDAFKDTLHSLISRPHDICGLMIHWVECLYSCTNRTFFVVVSRCLKVLLSAGVQEMAAVPLWAGGPSVLRGPAEYLISGSFFRSTNLGRGRSKGKRKTNPTLCETDFYCLVRSVTSRMMTFTTSRIRLEELIWMSVFA